MSKRNALSLCLGGPNGLCVGVRGTTSSANNAALVLLAASAGAAVVMAGYGAFRYLAGRRPLRLREPEPTESKHSIDS